MINRQIASSLVFLFLIFISTKIQAQNDTLRIGTRELFELAEKQSTQLQLSKLAIDESAAQTADTKTAKLPMLETGLSLGYISNIGIIGLNSGMPDGWYDMPHFSNSFSIQAAYLLYSGGKINNAISMSKIQEEISHINYEKSAQDVKLILAGYLLDLHTMMQQRKVYESNIQQSKALLKKIENRYKAGLVLKSDYVRNELLVANFELALLKLNNRIKIWNHRMIETLNLPDSTIIFPVKPLNPDIMQGEHPQNMERLKLEASTNNPENKISALQIQLAEKNIKMVKANQLPQVSLYAANNLNRPFIYDIPALDLYANIFTAGIKINYNLSSLYNNKHKKQKANIQLMEAKTADRISKEHINQAVHESFVIFQEAKDQQASIEKENELAQENYRRVSNSYQEQMALITDLMDASNSLLTSQLRLEQAKTQITFNYYQILKTTGNLK
ncbi:MAG: TolC family protein [Sphingobacteriales bacterium]|nr:TolC family protein [Sphingobacteriales bacterium]